MMKVLKSVLFTAVVLMFVQAFAQDNPSGGGFPGEKVKSIKECLSIYDGLLMLDEHHKIVVRQGKSDEAVDSVPYKIAPAARDAISHDMFLLESVRQEAQAANRRIQKEVAGDEVIKPNTKENLLFDRRINEYIDRPCGVLNLDKIKESDLNSDINEIPANVISKLWPILIK